jgi:hypothetical protein
MVRLLLMKALEANRAVNVIENNKRMLLNFYRYSKTL